MEDRGNIIFYQEWWDQIKELDREKRQEAVMAVMEYAYEGKIPEDPMMRFATGLMRERIDRDSDRYSELSEKRKTASKKGHKARWGGEEMPNASEKCQTHDLASEKMPNASEKCQTHDLASEKMPNASEKCQTHFSECQNENLACIPIPTPIPIPKSSDDDDEYVVFRSCGKTVAGVAVVNEIKPKKFLEMFFSSKNRRSHDSLQKEFRCGLPRIRDEAEKILDEWALTHDAHKDYSDAAKHLVSHLRIKFSEYKKLDGNGDNKNDCGLSGRRGTEPGTTDRRSYDASF